ncbi:MULTISPECIES: SDR family oxidoreductase [Clostridia]|uniref:SDR family NAD(P)-dependent oxidoreductase n=1 Tax=Clostridia TaxID=186801 RepID=UPI001A9ABF4D|nr:MULTISPECIES: SDR family oxidoreductase [Clostridia]MCH1936285.1 SDR family oxidoreductase [Enterocloster sp. OA11]
MKEKVALVTGAGSGIGQAIAKYLAEAGATVVIIGRTESTLKETAELNKNISYLVSDISIDENITAIIDEVKKRYARLDVLINNAGVAPVTPLAEVLLQEYDTAFITNVRAVVDLTRQALPMLKAVRGNVINISSTAAEKPIPNMSIYSASKAAMSALTKSWAKEMAKDGVRFNNVIVGPIETPIYDKTDLSDEGAQKHREFVLGTIPMGRYGEPNDVASAVLFLASDETKFVTGADFAVDGGVRA